MRQLYYCHCKRRLYARAVANAYFHPSNLCATPKRYWNAQALHEKFMAHLGWLDDAVALEDMIQKLCVPPPRAQVDNDAKRAKLVLQLANLEEAYLAGDYGEDLKAARPYYRKKKMELETRLQELPDVEIVPRAALEEYVVRGMLEDLREALHVTARTDAHTASMVVQQWFARVRVRGDFLFEPEWHALEGIIETTVQV